MSFTGTRKVYISKPTMFLKREDIIEDFKCARTKQIFCHLLAEYVANCCNANLLVTDGTITMVLSWFYNFFNVVCHGVLAFRQRIRRLILSPSSGRRPFLLSEDGRRHSRPWWPHYVNTARKKHFEISVTYRDVVQCADTSKLCLLAFIHPCFLLLS
jgi:hypothetical protein